MNDFVNKFKFLLLFTSASAFILTGCIEDPEAVSRDEDGGAPEVMSCAFEGVEYPDGAAIPAGDGCNTCRCENGIVDGCTEISCQPEECTEEACGPAPGVPSRLCDDGITMAGRGPCERQENGECAWCARRLATWHHRQSLQTQTVRRTFQPLTRTSRGP